MCVVDGDGVDEPGGFGVKYQVPVLPSVLPPTLPAGSKRLPPTDCVTIDWRITLFVPQSD